MGWKYVGIAISYLVCGRSNCLDALEIQACVCRDDQYYTDDNILIIMV